jgi:hypothetical protein
VNAEFAGNSLVDDPNVKVEVEKLDADFKEGANLTDYGGLSWNDRYEIYEVNVENPGEKPVDDINIEVMFPGCPVAFNKKNLKEKIFVRTKEPLRRVGGNAEIELNNCQKLIHINSLDRGESALLMVLVSKHYNKPPAELSEAFYFNTTFPRDGEMTYEWRFHDYTEQKSVNFTVDNAEDSYVELYRRISEGAIKSNKPGMAVYYMRAAYRINHSDPKIIRMYGYAIANYGESINDTETIHKGLELTKIGISKNRSNPWGWMYRSRAELYLASEVDSSKMSKEYYCKSLKSIKNAKRDGRLIKPARSSLQIIRNKSINVQC